MNNLTNGNAGSGSVDTISFDPKSKSGILTLDQLERTMKLEMASGRMPRVTPVEHTAVINQVIQLGTQLTGQKPVLGPIYIDEGYVRRLQFKGEKMQCPIENYHIERLVTKVEFKHDVLFGGTEDAEGSLAVAISYTDKGGIQVAFGHNVNICANMNIFGSMIWTTAGANKLEYEKGMQLLYSWLQNYDQSKKLIKEKILRLMDTPVDTDTRVKLLGTLFERAVRANNGDRTVDAPLNQADCAAMVRAGFDRIVENGDVTAWDITNWATNVLKPDRSDMTNVLLANNRINEFIYQELCAN